MEVVVVVVEVVIVEVVKTAIMRLISLA